MKDHSLYTEFYLDRDFERLEIFELIQNQLGVNSALYPGSFVHITPSFVIPEVVYVDSDKKAKKFFLESRMYDYIQSKKRYPQLPLYRFHPQDFIQEIPEKEKYFDLLISQYAGFVSQYAKRYLKTGGWLLVNNSHGDASMAYLDEGYRLFSIITGSLHRPRWITKDLETYFVPKQGSHPTVKEVFKMQKGIGYKNSAQHYVFQKIS